MTINFNPFYTSSVYVDENDCGIGISFLGPHAFLCELELRAGQSHGPDDGTRRTIRYMQAMNKTLAANPDIFFAKSFRRDDLGTAAILLQWRDSIRRYGWTPFTDTESEKLRGLAEVESFFDAEGPADRWRAILETVKGGAVLSPNDVIRVTCAKEDLEPLYREVLDEIEKHGTGVEYAIDLDVEKAPETLCFPNDIEAHQWLACQDYGEHDVLAGADSSLLNDMLYAQGRPLPGSSEEGIGPVMRLFTLGLSLFANPVSAIDLLAYLQLHRSPLNALHLKCEGKNGMPYYRPLNCVLADILRTRGGMGEEWQKSIDNAVYDREGALLDSGKRHERLAFIGMWEHTDKSSGLVARDDVLKFVSLLGKWARGHFRAAGEEADPMEGQYHALESFCENMKILLESQGPDVNAAKVSMWAGHIMHPITLASEYPRLGSINSVSHLGDIHSVPDHIYWFGAEVRNSVSSPFSFLSRSDCADLAAHGVAIPEREAMLKASRNISMNTLARAREGVTIVTCTRIGSEQTTPNLILAELTQKFDLKANEQQFTPPSPETHPVIQDSGKAVEVEIRPCRLEDYGKIQSASSVEKLINHPYDYYITYILGLTGYGTEGIEDKVVMMGNIVHTYMHDLGMAQGHDLDRMITEHFTGFDARFEKVTRERGIIFLSDENAIEYRNFRTEMKESVRKLLKMMKDMRLTIVDQEYPFQVELDVIGPFKGFVDCLLKDSNGDYVIFDFKYGWQKYKRKVEEGRAIQLALYRKAIEKEKQARVSFCGYYSFIKQELYSDCTPAVPAEGFERIEPIHPGDTFSKVCNSFLYRKRQLASGILEEADGLALADIQYVRDMSTFNLLHLDDAEGEIKEYAYGGENHILKGDLK